MKLLTNCWYFIVPLYLDMDETTVWRQLHSFCSIDVFCHFWRGGGWPGTIAYDEGDDNRLALLDELCISLSFLYPMRNVLAIRTHAALYTQANQSMLSGSLPHLNVASD